MKILIPIICSIIGTIGGFLGILVIDFFLYRRAIKKRYCKDCLWHIHKKEQCLKHAYIENFSWVWPHKSPHCTCSEFKYGKFNLYDTLFNTKENEVSDG